MRRKWSTCILLSTLLVGVSIGAIAKHAAAPEDQNMALIVGEAGERYPIIGAGGIRVSGGHHGIFMSNVKSSTIQIDGSELSIRKMIPFNETADFTASANCAYFVAQNAVCTLATAADVGGQEIVVCNAGNGVTVTYQTTNGETLIGGEKLGVLTANKTPGKVDRFISDGKSWYRE